MGHGGAGCREKREGSLAMEGACFWGLGLLDVRSEGPEAMPGSTPLPTPLPLQASESGRKKRQVGTGESGGRLGEAGLCSALEVTDPDRAARLPDQLL